MGGKLRGGKTNSICSGRKTKTKKRGGNFKKKKPSKQRGGVGTKVRITRPWGKVGIIDHSRPASRGDKEVLGRKKLRGVK